MRFFLKLKSQTSVCICVCKVTRNDIAIMFTQESMKGLQPEMEQSLKQPRSLSWTQKLFPHQRNVYIDGWSQHNSFSHWGHPRTNKSISVTNETLKTPSEITGKSSVGICFDITCGACCCVWPSVYFHPHYETWLLSGPHRLCCTVSATGRKNCMKGWFGLKGPPLWAESTCPLSHVPIQVDVPSQNGERNAIFLQISAQ